MELEIAIPSGLDDLKLPSPELLTYYKNLQNRTIWIDYDVDMSLMEVIRQIVFFNQQDKGVPIEDRQPIKILICTDGGLLDACIGFVDVCLLSKTPIYTVNMQNCLSAGLYMLSAGTKRYCLPNSRAMYHSGSGGAQGSLELIKSSIEEHERQVDVLRTIFLSRTKIDKRTFNKFKEKEWYMDADDQLKYGVVDSIIESLDEIL